MIAAAILIPLLIALLVMFRFRRTLIPMIDETKWLWPVPGSTRITSKFGQRHAPTAGASTMHYGIDIGARVRGVVGDDIVAPWDGQVRSVFTTSGGGNQLLIAHSDGRVSGYAHLDRVLVQPGQIVSRGEVIAKMGNTGTSTAAHLHFTVRPAEGAPYIDPETLYA